MVAKCAKVVLCSLAVLLLQSYASSGFAADAQNDDNAIVVSDVAPPPAPAVAPKPAEAAPAPDDCQADGCGENCACGPAGRFWMRADALMWWTKGTQLPPLVVSDVAILSGDSTVNDRLQGGVDATMGMWLDCCHTWGLEGDYLDLGRQETRYNSGFSNGNPPLFRPFNNTETGTQDAELVAYTGVIAGRVTTDATTAFQSAGIDLRRNLYCCECCDQCDGCSDSSCGCNTCCSRSLRVDMTGGYRYYGLSDGVGVHESLVTLQTSGPIEIGTGYEIQDSFGTKNSFNGCELGLVTNYTNCRWSFQLSGKLAAGDNHEVVNINGSTEVIAPSGQAAILNGGLLALDTNIGSYSRNEFMVIPEFGLEVGYQLTCHLRVFAGYDFIYWGQVVRAADQINLNVDPRNLPGATNTAGANPDPSFSFQSASFWAQGIRLGAELRF